MDQPIHRGRQAQHRSIQGFGSAALGRQALLPALPLVALPQACLCRRSVKQRPQHATVQRSQTSRAAHSCTVLGAAVAVGTGPRLDTRLSMPYRAWLARWAVGCVKGATVQMEAVCGRAMRSRDVSSRRLRLQEGQGQWCRQASGLPCSIFCAGQDGVLP